MICQVNLSPLRDVQREEPRGVCARCGGELWPCDQGEVCAQCRESIRAERLQARGARYAEEAFQEHDLCRYSSALGCLFGLLSAPRPPEERLEIMRAFRDRWEELMSHE